MDASASGPSERGEEPAHQRAAEAAAARRREQVDVQMRRVLVRDGRRRRTGARVVVLVVELLLARPLRLGRSARGRVGVRRPQLRQVLGLEPRGELGGVECAKRVPAHRAALVLDHERKLRLELEVRHRPPLAERLRIHRVVGGRVVAGVAGLEANFADGVAVGEGRAANAHRDTGTGGVTAQSAAARAGKQRAASAAVSIGQSQLRALRELQQTSRPPRCELSERGVKTSAAPRPAQPQWLRDGNRRCRSSPTGSCLRSGASAASRASPRSCAERRS